MTMAGHLDLVGEKRRGKSRCQVSGVRCQQASSRDRWRQAAEQLRAGTQVAARNPGLRRGRAFAVSVPWPSWPCLSRGKMPVAQKPTHAKMQVHPEILLKTKEGENRVSGVRCKEGSARFGAKGLGRSPVFGARILTSSSSLLSPVSRKCRCIRRYL